MRDSQRIFMFINFKGRLEIICKGEFLEVFK